MDFVDATALENDQKSSILMAPWLSENQAALGHAMVEFLENQWTFDILDERDQKAHFVPVVVQWIALNIEQRFEDFDDRSNLLQKRSHSHLKSALRLFCPQGLSLIHI